MIKYKYYLFKYLNNIMKLVAKSLKMSLLKEKIIGKKLNIESEYILLKLSKEPKFNPNATGMNRLIGGPIKITFKIFYITENSILYPKYETIRNRNGTLDPDKRNAQFVYINIEFLEKYGIMDEDIIRLAKLAIENKLEKRLMAPKLITQIN